MSRAFRTPPAVAARDAALRRLRRVRRALAAGTVLLAVALTILATRGFSGHAAAATHVVITPITKTHAVRRPATSHRSAGPPERSRNRKRSEKRLAQPSAPPAAAQTTPSPAPTTAQTTPSPAPTTAQTTPGPTPPPAPVVTGGGS